MSTFALQAALLGVPSQLGETSAEDKAGHQLSGHQLSGQAALGF